MEIEKCYCCSGLGPQGTRPSWVRLGPTHLGLSAWNQKQGNPHSPCRAVAHW
jgi:hypothetical protein